ncbi:MAG: serine hydrolase [Tepidisphaeraceae bacterium]
MIRRNATEAMLLAGLVLMVFSACAGAESPGPSLEQRLDALVTEVYPASNDPGLAVLVMVDGKPVLRRGYGVADLQSGARVTPDMVFRLASVTKQFTAVCVLQLVQAGKVLLTDPISKYVPEFDTQGKTITIENLLSHSSGIPNVTAQEEFKAQQTKDLKPVDTFALIAGKPLEFEPGSRFKYSNTNYLLLGVVIEKVSGQTYAEYLDQHIAKPLGLADTRYSRDDAHTPRHARGYEKDESGKWAPASPISMTQPYAAGAIESTVDELAKWTMALDEGKLIDPALRDRAWTPFSPSESPSPYGFGWNIREEAGERWIGHAGGINGFMSEAVWIPEKKVFVAVLRNGLGDAAPALLVRQLALEAVGRPAPKRVIISLPATTLDRYVGIFAVTPELKFTFSRTDQKLFVEVPGKTTMELFAEAEDKFFSKEIDAQFVFMVEEGKSKQLTITRSGRSRTASRE